MLPSPTVMVLVPFSVFISKEYSLSGERSETVFMSLPFSYISAEFSPLFPPVSKINIRHAAITAAKTAAHMRFFLLPLSHSPFYSISVVMSIPQPFFFVKTNGKCLIFCT